MTTDGCHDGLMAKQIESPAHAAVLEKLTRQAIQRMVATGQEGPRR
jgi:hypothetical protein